MLRRTLPALAAVAVVAAGCSDGGPGPARSATAPTTPAATSTTVAADPVAVLAVDYAFDGLPDRVPAGTPVRLTNASTTEAHELVAVRLADGDERTVDELVALPAGEVDALVGRAAATATAGPGGEVATATLDRPGRYLVVCTLPTGAAGGPPHFTAGMYGQIVVLGGN
ncbi:MAG TPA: hypothetical protein VF640_04845 [Acidimicrobiales bacterium]|jgi:plastocyanin